MPRTKKGGWLKADALKTAGIGEQWSDGRVEVRLSWNSWQRQYLVTVDVYEDRSFTNYRFGDDLNAARGHFRRIVRRYGGRA